MVTIPTVPENPKWASTAATKTVAITQNVVAGGSSRHTCTHAAALRSLVVGDKVTVSGHSDAALNQEFTVTAVTSSTVVELTGSGSAQAHIQPELQY